MGCNRFQFFRLHFKPRCKEEPEEIAEVYTVPSTVTVAAEGSSDYSVIDLTVDSSNSSSTGSGPYNLTVESSGGSSQPLDGWWFDSQPSSSFSVSDASQSTMLILPTVSPVQPVSAQQTPSESGILVDTRWTNHENNPPLKILNGPHERSK